MRLAELVEALPEAKEPRPRRRREPVIVEQEPVASPSLPERAVPEIAFKIDASRGRTPLLGLRPRGWKRRLETVHPSYEEAITDLLLELNRAAQRGGDPASGPGQFREGLPPATPDMDGVRACVESLGRAEEPGDVRDTAIRVAATALAYAVNVERKAHVARGLAA